MITRRPALERDVLDGVVVLAADRPGPPVKLNGSAATVWDLLADHRTFDALVGELQDIYRIDDSILLTDVERALEQLEQYGLIER